MQKWRTNWQKQKAALMSMQRWRLNMRPRTRCGQSENERKRAWRSTARSFGACLRAGVSDADRVSTCCTIMQKLLDELKPSERGLVAATMAQAAVLSKWAQQNQVLRKPPPLHCQPLRQTRARLLTPFTGQRTAAICSGRRMALLVTGRSRTTTAVP